MQNKTDKLRMLLSRTPLTQDFDHVLADVETQLPIGKILFYKPINEGYEDANILIKTTTGQYVLKVFLTNRSDQAIADYTKILLECKKIGVKTTELVVGASGPIGIMGKAKYIITIFFEGENFQHRTPTPADMIAGVRYLAKLNTLSFPIAETYDSWGNRNLAREHEALKNKLSPQELELINPALRGFKALNFSEFSKSVIHGDMQRKHLLKNTRGQYCILDFGCMAHAPKVIDLSTYLAWFCLAEDTWINRDLIYTSIVEEYTKTHNLSDIEHLSLKPLIRASYAAYFQKTSELIHDGDNSAETLDWHQKSKTILGLSLSW